MDEKIAKFYGISRKTASFEERSLFRGMRRGRETANRLGPKKSI